MATLPFISDCADKGPDTLLNLCSKYVVQHLETIGTVNPITKDLRLNQDIALPTEICEKLLQDYQRESRKILDDQFVNIFNNTQTTRLQRVKLRNAKITDYGLRSLMRHKLTELEVAHCTKLTEKSLDHLNENSNNLLSLVIGVSSRILPQSLVTEDPQMDEVGSVYLRRGYILKAPKLRRLAVRYHRVPLERMYFPTLIRPLHNLTYLDLSSCCDLGNLSYIEELKGLLSLILHNVEQLQDSMTSICKLKTLRHLDISQSSEKHGVFRYENQTLANIVENLPRLTSLDISGTNLAGTGVAEQSGANKEMVTGEHVPKTDIPGLSSRVSKPFEFLGLYGTMHGACRRHDIPAKMISGDANEAQILVAAAAYIDRPEVLQKVLNELYHLFRYETCQNMNQALGTVLEAMNRHINEKHIQISGSATLFYIVKGKENRQTFGPKMKRSIISSLLNGMAAHKDDDTMLRNGCLTLCQFKIPEDVLFDYERLVHILLYIVSEMEQEGFVQRIGIYLLNSLACQVDGCQKQLLGDLGAVERMLALIEDRLERRVCDDVLEVAWSTLWNITDETAINCLRFLNGKGMEFFLGCLSTFPDKEELLRNMMGLLGNVAEVQTLRPRLMTSQFVSVFADLLDSCSDGIEVSYNAAGVLSHMASDGPGVWSLSSPRREDVLARMVSAIERWDLGTERNINYRSFEPILYLARVYHSPACQHWAIWALANLTKVYRKSNCDINYNILKSIKYCSLVEAEGGLAVLDEIIQHPLPYPRIKELAVMVRDNCNIYQAHQWHDNLHQMLTLDG